MRSAAEMRERLACAAAATGTSALPDPPGDPAYGWQDTVVPARDHLSGDDMLCLPREHLEAFTTALAEGRVGDARVLTRRCAESPARLSAASRWTTWPQHAPRYRPRYQ